jgi:RNA polymerase sigma factor (sigma-70 family)
MNGMGQSLGLPELMTHAGWLRRLAVSLVRDGDVADDIVQSTLVTAWSQPPGTDRDVRPWLAEVARNQAHDHRRGEGRRRVREEVATSDPGLSAPEAPRSPEQLIGDLEIHRSVAEVVTALDPIYRDTLVLHYYEGISAADIARDLGIPAGTVRWRLKEGIDRVRAELDRRHEGDRQRWRRALLPLVPAEILGRAAGGGATSPATQPVRPRATPPPAPPAPRMTARLTTRAGMGAIGIVAAGVTLILLAVYTIWPGSTGRKDLSNAGIEATVPALSGGQRRPLVAPASVPRFANPTVPEEDAEAGRAQREADGIMRRMLAAIADSNYDAFLEHGHDIFKAAFPPAQMRALNAELGKRLRGGYEAQPLGSLRSKEVMKIRPVIYLWKLQLLDGGEDLLVKLALVDGSVVGFFTL